MKYYMIFGILFIVGCTSLDSSKTQKKRTVSNTSYIHHKDLKFEHHDYVMNDDIKELTRLIVPEISRNFRDQSINFSDIRKQVNEVYNERKSLYNKRERSLVGKTTNMRASFYHKLFIPDSYFQSLDYTQNYFGSYLYLTYQEPDIPEHYTKFNFVQDPNVMEKIEANLGSVSSPIVENTISAKEITYTAANGSRVTRNSSPRIFSRDDEVEKEYLTHLRKLNVLSSPLFEWILQNRNELVKHSDIFVKAMELYSDPFVAMGVISHVLDYDCGTRNRNKFSIVNSRVAAVLSPEHDKCGQNYHFWGYLVRSIAGESNLLNLKSKVYESWMKKDHGDRAADMLGIYIGTTIRGNVEAILRTVVQ